MIAKDYILDIARLAVADQIEEFRSILDFDNLHCEITGLKLNKAICQIDHVIHFEKLVFDFVVEQMIDFDLFIVARKWHVFEAEWQCYHFHNAILRPVYKRANLHRSKANVDWDSLIDGIVHFCETNAVADIFCGHGFRSMEFSKTRFEKIEQQLLAMHPDENSAYLTFSPKETGPYKLILPPEGETWESFAGASTRDEFRSWVFKSKIWEHLSYKIKTQ